jgi:hypothetical protein
MSLSVKLKFAADKNLFVKCIFVQHYIAQQKGIAFPGTTSSG